MCAASAPAAAASVGSTPAVSSVGPQSAGSEPGPACYGRGGTHATVTDASLELGFIDPEHFLGGAMELIAGLARGARARCSHAARALAGAGAAAMLRVVTERMVAAIEDITLRQGVDPATAVLVGGGGAAGLNIVAIAPATDAGRDRAGGRAGAQRRRRPRPRPHLRLRGHLPRRPAASTPTASTGS